MEIECNVRFVLIISFFKCGSTNNNRINTAKWYLILIKTSDSIPSIGQPRCTYIFHFFNTLHYEKQRIIYV